MTHDEKSIRALLGEYEQLLNASDAESIADLFSADGIFMPQGFPTAAGREAVLQSYRAIFEGIVLTIEFEIDEIVAGEGIATALTRSKGSVRRKRCLANRALHVQQGCVSRLRRSAGVASDCAL